MSCIQRLEDLSLDDFFFVKEGWIPVTLPSLWETLGLKLSKVGIISFGNPS